MRDEKIDIMKALAILMVVMGHATCPLKKYIIIFHVAIFFMTAGWCFNENYSKNISGLWKLFTKRIVTLYVPYVLCNGAYTILNNLFVKLHIYADVMKVEPIEGVNISLKHMLSFNENINSLIKVFLGEGTTLGGATWFLKTLLGVTVISASIHYIALKCKNIILKNVIVIASSVGLLICGYILGTKQMMLAVGTILSCIVIYELGFYIRKLGCWYDAKWKYCVSTLVALTVIIICANIGHVQYSYNDYTSPIMLVLTAISGWVVTYNLSILITKSGKIKKIFLYIGKSTMPILLLHFLCFKVVTMLQIVIYKEPLYYLALFPVNRSNGLWWLLYVIVGIGLPLIVNVPYNIAKNKIRNIIRRRVNG